MTLLFEGDTIDQNGLVCREGVDYDLDAIQTESGEWCVRPKGVTGVYGYYYGRSWAAVFVTAQNESVAIRKAKQYVWRQR